MRPQLQAENQAPGRVESGRQYFSVVRREVEKTRLIVEGGATVSVAEVLSKLNAALSEFGKGELNVAVSLVRAAAGLYQDKLSRWESLVRQREDSVKQRSVQKFRQVQAVHNPIRTNTRQIPGNFQHLVDCLEERIKKESQQDATSKGNIRPAPENKRLSQNNEAMPGDLDCGKSFRTGNNTFETPDETPRIVADDQHAFDLSEVLTKAGIRAVVDLVGEGLLFEFSGARLEPSFSNAFVREQLWQNKSLALVVTWSNGNRLVDADSAPLTLHLWMIPKTVQVSADLESLGKQPLSLIDHGQQMTESILFTPATGRTPATPYNKRIRRYISGKAREFKEAAGEGTALTVYTDSVYTNRPFGKARQDSFMLRVPEQWRTETPARS